MTHIKNLTIEFPNDVLRIYEDFSGMFSTSKTLSLFALVSRVSDLHVLYVESMTITKQKEIDSKVSWLHFNTDAFMYIQLVVITPII